MDQLAHARGEFLVFDLRDHFLEETKDEQLARCFLFDPARKHVEQFLLVDLAGPKVRAAFGDEPVELVTGSTVEIRGGESVSTSTEIHVNVDDIAQSLVVGDRLQMGDGTATLTVTEVGAEFATATVEYGLRVGTGTAATVEIDE